MRGLCSIRHSNVIAAAAAIVLIFATPAHATKYDITAGSRIDGRGCKMTTLWPTNSMDFAPLTNMAAEYTKQQVMDNGTAVSNQVVAESNRASWVEASISNQVVAESNRASWVEQSISNQIIALSNLTAWIDGSLSNQVIAESNRASIVEAHISNMVENVSNLVVAVSATVFFVDAAISNQVVAESNRAAWVEGSISNQVIAESNRAARVELSLSNQTIAVSNLYAVITHSLSNQIIAESNRASWAEAHVSNMTCNVSNYVAAVSSVVFFVDAAISNQVVAESNRASWVEVFTSNHVEAVSGTFAGITHSISNQVVAESNRAAWVEVFISNHVENVSGTFATITHSISNQVVAESNRASWVEVSLSNQILVVSNQVNDLSNTTAWVDCSISNQVIAESNRASVVEISLSNQILVVSNQVSTLSNTLAWVDGSLSNQIVAESNRASWVEQSISNQVIALSNRTAWIDGSLSNQIVAESNRASRSEAHISNMVVNTSNLTAKIGRDVVHVSNMVVAVSNRFEAVTVSISQDVAAIFTATNFAGSGVPKLIITGSYNGVCDGVYTFRDWSTPGWSWVTDDETKYLYVYMGSWGGYCPDGQLGTYDMRLPADKNDWTQYGMLTDMVWHSVITYQNYILPGQGYYAATVPGFILNVPDPAAKLLDMSHMGIVVYPSNTIELRPDAVNGHPYQKQTVKDAVDAAQEGQIIMVYPGTYTVDNVVDLGSKRMVGVDRDACRIRATGVEKSVFVVDGGELKNLTLYSESRSVMYMRDHCISGSAVRIENCTIRDMQDVQLIWCDTITVVRSTIEACAVPLAVTFEQPRSMIQAQHALDMTDVTFTSCTQQYYNYGQSFIRVGSASPSPYTSSFIRCMFSKNLSVSNLVETWNPVVFEDCQFIGNTALATAWDSADAIVYQRAGRMSRCKFDSNAGHADLRVRDLLVENSAFLSPGTTYSLNEEHYTKVWHCTMYKNSIYSAFSELVDCNLRFTPGTILGLKAANRLNDGMGVMRLTHITDATSAADAVNKAQIDANHLVMVARTGGQVINVDDVLGQQYIYYWAGEAITKGWALAINAQSNVIRATQNTCGFVGIAAADAPLGSLVKVVICGKVQAKMLSSVTVGKPVRISATVGLFDLASTVWTAVNTITWKGVAIAPMNGSNLQLIHLYNHY